MPKKKIFGTLQCLVSKNEKVFGLAHFVWLGYHSYSKLRKNLQFAEAALFSSNAKINICCTICPFLAHYLYMSDLFQENEV